MTKSRKKEKKLSVLNRRVAAAAAAVLVFIAAFIYYFLNTYIETEREYAVYTSMEEPSLPVVFAIANGININAMHGYLQEMESLAASDCITPLSEDRKLDLRIKLYGIKAAGMSYEIRSLDTEHFIEKTVIDNVTEADDGDTIVSLPIQNLIKKDTPYLLKFQIDLGEQTVNYYTRIIWPSNDNIFRMIQASEDFTVKSFDYEKARDLTIYLETDSGADNSSLGTVSINSSFSQITWADSGMMLDSDPLITVREYDGIMGAVQVSYTSKTVDVSGNEDSYYNTDNFTMRIGPERVYMMNFQRKTNQIFNGNKHAFSGKRIVLGITNQESLQTLKSDNNRYIAFKSGKELWLYDQTGKNAINIFSFRSETDKLRADYDRHDIKILSLDNDGTLDFVVYGYINRGRHEGYNGIIYYQYETGSNTLSELFFMPVTNTYEKIKQEIDELITKNDMGMVYVKQNEAVTAIDLTSLEMLDIVSGLSGNRYAISNNQKKIAWIDGSQYQTNNIKIMDLMTGNTQTIAAEPGKILSVIDFYNSDLLYGISNSTDVSISNGRVTGMPVHTLMIIDQDLNNIMEYQKSDLYFDNIQIENDRIQLTQYRKDYDSGKYRFSSLDTIVCSETEEDLNHKGIATDNNATKKKIFYIELDENIKTTRSLSINVPQNISYETAGVIDLPVSMDKSVMRYYAYANNSLKCIAYSLEEALDSVYDDMGWITDINSAVLYSRADRTSSKTISEPFNAASALTLALENGKLGDQYTESGHIIMDAYGIELNKLLYYIYKDHPIMAILDNNDYCLIYGYTTEEIYLFYPSDNESINVRQVMDTEEAAAYFDRYQNNFLVLTENKALQ